MPVPGFRTPPQNNPPLIVTGTPVTGQVPVVTKKTGQPAKVAWSAAPTSISITSGHGAIMQMQSIEEEIVIANAATTDSVTNLLPANAIIYGVCARVTGTLANARTWSLGYVGATNTFAASGQSGTLGTLTNTYFTGTVSPGGPSPINGPQATPNGNTGTKIRVTLSNADGGDGATTKIRVCVLYMTCSNLTS